MSYEIEINNLSTLQEMFKKAPQTCDKYLEAGTKDAGIQIVSQMQREAPQGATKKLHTNIATEYRPIQIRVYPTMDYAIFVNNGTKAHLILPNGKKALFWKGAVHPVKAVKHPGTKANPFVERTVDNTKDNINLIFASVLNKIINNM